MASQRSNSAARARDSEARGLALELAALAVEEREARGAEASPQEVGAHLLGEHLDPRRAVDHQDDRTHLGRRDADPTRHVQRQSRDVGPRMVVPHHPASRPQIGNLRTRERRDRRALEAIGLAEDQPVAA